VTEAIDLFNAEVLMLPDELIPVKKVASRRVLKRREQFVMVPLRWLEILAEAEASGQTCRLALYLAHLAWKHKGQPFKLPNGLVGEVGVSRWSKYRALDQLAGLGLITVERRARKSPVIMILP
jgi:hypothetical protein